MNVLIAQTLSAHSTKLFTNPERASLTYVLEKKLVSAIDELIDEVIELYPNLGKALAKIQRVLRKMVA